MDRKKDERRNVTSGRSGRLAYKNAQKKTNEISWPNKQKRWTRKTCALWEDGGKKM